MAKIFGKTLLLSITLMLQSQATIRLQLQNMQGQTITQAAVGQTFILNVTVSDIASKIVEPTIDGMEHVAFNQVGYQVTLINGAQSVQYRYQARIDTPGTYQLGPAHIAQPMQSSEPQTITIVAQATVTAMTGGKRYAQAQPVVELVVDRDHLYVGQQVRAILRFIASDAERISLEPFVTQAMPAFTVYNTSQPHQKQIMIDGKGYNQVEVQIDMVAKKAGRAVIPAQFIDYTKELAVDHSLGAFAAFFGPRFERKRVHSNAVTLDIMALPPHTPPVDLIAELRRFDATIEPNVAQQYEGLVLKLIFEGHGYFAGMPTPELHQMPQELKYYRSKTDLQELADGQQRYICEYIVQGLQAGDYEIPAQSITYFDTESGSYKTKSTTPLFITIMPTHQQSHLREQTVPEPESANKQMDEQSVEVSPLAPLQQSKEGSSAMLVTYTLPWWILVVIALLLCGYAYVLQYAHYCSSLLERIAPRYMQQKLYARIKHELQQAASSNNYTAIQHQFAELIAQRMHCAPEQVDVATMIAYVDATSWPLEKRQRWQQFLKRLNERLYAHQEDMADKQLFAAAQLWIEEFERIM